MSKASYLISLLEKAEYKMSKEQLEFPISSVEGIAIYDMPPLEFLKLTTSDQNQIDQILSSARPLKDYNSNKSIIHPFVRIKPDGTINGHEGRHRAAAVHNEGGKVFKVAIVATEWEYANKGYGWRWKRDLPVPDVLKGQFTNYKHKVNKSKAEQIKRV